MRARILCVDDDPNLLAALERNLRKQFDIVTAGSGELGLVALQEKGPFAVILSDMGMPGMDGSAFLREASHLVPETVRIMLTGYNDQQTALKAVNDGHVFCFINKPCETVMLIQTLHAAVQQYHLIIAEGELLDQTLNGSVKLLTDLLSMADPLAFGRATLLRDYAHEYLAGCGHEDAKIWEIELAAMLLNLGHITIPAGVLEKEAYGSTLSINEMEIMTRVPETGAELISNIPRLGTVAEIIRYQKKRFDGSGLPADDAKEQAIPFGSRLLKALKDLIEREASGLTRSSAIAALRERKGYYDPAILENLGKHLKSRPSSEMQSEQVATVLVNELTTKHVLVSALTTKEGIVIAPAGTEISALILQKIRNFGTLHGLAEPIQVKLRS